MINYFATKVPNFVQNFKTIHVYSHNRLTYTTIVTIGHEAKVTIAHKTAIGVDTFSINTSMQVTATTFIYICNELYTMYISNSHRIMHPMFMHLCYY